GSNLDQTIGRIHVAEKSAGIYLAARGNSTVTHYLSNEQLDVLCERFNCDIDPAIMRTDLKI
ncbi:MAG: hypothetical protein MI744_07995, partial [Pseudomonadales bacterium]|nr:hypothetical protein [Pseudomonadales bacterium]